MQMFCYFFMRIGDSTVIQTGLGKKCDSNDNQRVFDSVTNSDSTKLPKSTRFNSDSVFFSVSLLPLW